LEEKIIDSELIVGELLGLAVNLDYADETGRRKMFQLIRAYILIFSYPYLRCLCVGDILSQEALPEGLVNKSLDVLRKLSENERDLIRVVVEIVTELRDVLIKDGDVPVSAAFLPYECSPNLNQTFRPRVPKPQTIAQPNGETTSERKLGAQEQLNLMRLLRRSSSISSRLI
jgi:hypothetical protein